MINLSPSGLRGCMETMDQQLLERRGQLAQRLADAEEESRKLQAKIVDWRRKIAAIDTLTEESPTGAESEHQLETDDTDNDGVFTPRQAYWRPILQVLVEMGGRGKRRKVIDAVGDKMKTFSRRPITESSQNLGGRGGAIALHGRPAKCASRGMSGTTHQGEFGKSRMPDANGSTTTRNAIGQRGRGRSALLRPFSLAGLGLDSETLSHPCHPERSAAK
jgi:hypothetical protein